MTYRFVPAGSEPITIEGLRGVVYKFEVDGRPAAVMYVGNQGRPSVYQIYASEGDRKAGIERFWNALRDQQDEKAKHLAENRKRRAAFHHDWQTGDILEYTWGYEQTNAEFYQVIGLRGDYTVVIRQIGQDNTAGGHLSGYAVPRPNVFIGPELMRRVVAGSGGITERGIIGLEHGVAHIWTGKPVRFTSYA